MLHRERKGTLDLTYSKLNKRTLGIEKERMAEQFLREKGYHILSHNFYCRTGEIDIIAREKEYLVFVEVKYRSSERKGTPEEAIDRKKIRSIVKCAQFYMLRHGIAEDTSCRFDVVVILEDHIRLIKDAFEA